MNNLIVCCDGTWDTTGQSTHGVPTNVARLYNAVLDADRGAPGQIKYYHSGVGSAPHWWRRIAGGLFGIGLDQHIQSAYHWLGVHYTSGAAIYCLGFSRGAFTVRSLVGMIDAVGLLDLSNLADEQAWPRVRAAYEKGYRKASTNWHDDWALHDDGQPIPIRFLGVWETVGALGIPDDIAVLNLFSHPQRYAFLNTRLSAQVQTARQAVALDERRANFTPTLWRDIDPDRDVAQLWFPGVHKDVGGGYPETGLADSALGWMIDAARSCGLAVDERMRAELKPDPRGVLHDSVTGLFDYLPTRPRSTPPLTDTAVVHPAAIERHEKPPISETSYWPTRLLSPGQQMTVEVFAREHWNATGLYLEHGARYACQATGQWLNSGLACGPGGRGPAQSLRGIIRRGLQTLAGRFESAYRHVTHRQNTDLPGTRRDEDSPWGALIGAIANGGNPDIDGSPAPHQTVYIGRQAVAPVDEPGYLYCYMNDAWYCYHNNTGSLRLIVQRID